ncbi:hypothetical protein L6164_003158 [Bauhinia variegata]|uniref:Uncharacterized protein n=1 Tax=Bauhinia variegata TaxID=167791 RepID=A0ACB9PZV7_BAUVA|nr:hypothetical protein L6164_003158 [Bauhinia variegata]
MDTQKNFWLREFSKEESWELFKKKVALIESSKSEELLTIAKEVVAKCEIGKLTKLQLLDLSRCVQIESIPPGVLLNLQMLEVLLMGSSFSKWAVGDQQSTASLAEIKDLRKLNTLAIDVPVQNVLPKEQLFESLHLQRYEVCIGDKWRRFGESKTSRLLKLDLHTGIDTKHYFKSLLDHGEDLHVRRLADLKNVVPDINEKGLIELKHLVVDGNFELQFIADLSEHKDMIFPKLESLDVPY